MCVDVEYVVCLNDSLLCMGCVHRGFVQVHDELSVLGWMLKTVLEK